MFGGFGPWEILIIGLIVVLLFGARRIPELGRSLGGGIKEFKKGLTGDEENDKLPHQTDDTAGKDDHPTA